MGQTVDNGFSGGLPSPELDYHYPGLFHMGKRPNETEPPSGNEIVTRCAEIQAGWSEIQRIHRKDAAHEIDESGLFYSSGNGPAVERVARLMRGGRAG